MKHSLMTSAIFAVVTLLLIISLPETTTTTTTKTTSRKPSTRKSLNVENDYFVLFPTVQLDGSLYGVAMSESGAAVGVPFEISQKVKQGQFSWYDRLVKADRELGDGKYNSAIQTYESILSMQSFPKKYKPAVLLSLSRALCGIHRVFEAKKLVEIALQNQESGMKSETKLKLQLHFHLGLFRTMCGEMEDAIEAYKAALKMDPTHADSLNNLGILFFIIGDLESFNHHFLKYIKVMSTLTNNEKKKLTTTATTTTTTTKASSPPLPSRIPDYRLSSSYKSSFRKGNLENDMAIWFVNHIMFSFSVDHSPSLLQTAWILEENDKKVHGSRLIEGYRFGELSANLVLVYSAYQTASLVSNKKFRSMEKEMGGNREARSGPAVLDRELVHYNLAKRLGKTGAWKQAAWHFEYARQVGDPIRSAFLDFRATLQHEVSLPITANDQSILVSDRKSALEHFLLQSYFKNKQDLQNCAGLSNGILDSKYPRSPYLQPIDPLFRNVTRNACGGAKNLDFDIFKDRNNEIENEIEQGDDCIDFEDFASNSKEKEKDNNDKRKKDKNNLLHVCFIAPQMHNTTSGKMIVPIIASLARQHLQVRLFSWKPRETAEYMIDPNQIIHLDEFDIDQWRSRIQKEHCNVVIFVDILLDFRLYLLSFSKLGWFQVHLQLDRFTEQVASSPLSIDSNIKISPSTASRTSYVRMLVDLILMSDRDEFTLSATMRQDPILQGQYFFSHERYIFVPVPIHEIHPDFDNVIAMLHEKDSSIVFVFITLQDAVLTVQKFWSRMSNYGTGTDSKFNGKEPMQIDSNRIRLFTISSPSDAKVLLGNVDVILEPPSPSVGGATNAGASMILLIHALMFQAPILTLTSDGPCSLLCNALSLDDCLIVNVDNDDDDSTIQIIQSMVTRGSKVRSSYVSKSNQILDKIGLERTRLDEIQVGRDWSRFVQKFGKEHVII